MTSPGRAARACAKLGFFCLLLVALTAQAAAKAKNVIVFLADGASLATVSAASIYGYGEPRSLYVQQMPHTGLSETSAASQWVTDSAAGMTAIVTGHKTHNGVISQSASAVRGETDGEPLKTILEYAEEKGLSTGVISNSSMADATPAACYAHANDRAKQGEIFLQVLEPRFGDGVDVVIGYGRDGILKNTAALGADLPARLREKGFAYLETLESLNGLKPSDQRVVALFNDENFDLAAAVDHALRILARNRKGFF
jgi:alkaline phosphatase